MKQLNRVCPRCHNHYYPAKKEEISAYCDGCVRARYLEVLTRSISVPHGSPVGASLMAILGCVLLCLIVVPRASQAQEMELINLNQIVAAIDHAEGGRNAEFPYGIRSVPCKDREDCKRVCEQTVLKNVNRWLASGSKDSFVHYLAKRYAPRKARNDPRDLNRHWERNVKYYLRRHV